MPSTLELCETFYGTRDIYKLFEVEKDAQENEIKKAYYKLSLKTHPDRVPEEEKESATEKFKVLSKIYSVLSDKDKRSLYDEKGTIDDDDDDSLGAKWMSMWQQFFKPITTEDISNFEKEYVGSDLEKNDIKKAYLDGKGCLNYMFNMVPFMSCKDEPRISEIVKEMIASGDVPEYKIFTEEPKAKRARRHKKYAKEAQEAAAINEKSSKKETELSLEKQMAQRHVERQQEFSSFIDRLTQKYCGEDEKEYVVLKAKKATKKKSSGKTGRISK